MRIVKTAILVFALGFGATFAWLRWERPHPAPAPYTGFGVEVV